MSPTTAGDRPQSATVVIAQNVRPGEEGEYLRWQSEINAACRTFPGFEGAEIVPPVPGVQDDCVVVFRFDSGEHLNAWLRSDARQTLLARGQSLFAGAARQHVVAGARPGVGWWSPPASSRGGSTSIASGRTPSTRRPPGSRLHGQRGVPARAQIDGAVAMGFGAGRSTESGVRRARRDGESGAAPNYRIPAFADVPRCGVYFADTHDNGSGRSQHQDRGSVRSIPWRLPSPTRWPTPPARGFVDLPLSPERIFDKLGEASDKPD